VHCAICAYRDFRSGDKFTVSTLDKASKPMTDLRAGEAVPPFQVSQFLGYEPDSGVRPTVDFAQVVATTSRLLRENGFGILIISLIFSFLPQTIQPFVGSFEDIRAGIWFQLDADTSGDFGWFDLVTGIFSALSSGYVTLLVLSKDDQREAGFGEYVRASWPIFLISVIYSVGIVFGLVLLIVPGVLLALAWSVALPVLVNEKLGIIGSIGRSSDLTTGNRWQIFFTLAAILVLSFLLGLFGEFVGAFLGGVVLLPKFNEVFLSLMTVIGEVISTITIAALYLHLRACNGGPQLTQVADVFE
jgi:hypothetical protein